ncbi:MAG: ATP-binding cassette domain-containing protein [Firmicutes bacterium]|nr:ATP-binding cassette domain-containing protein [Bacillota bacterium]
MSNLAAAAIATSDIAIELSNVTKVFSQGRPAGLFRRGTRRVAALDGVSFSIRGGEFVAYAGPNGAGKSTTFKLLCGMLAPQSGRVSALGLDPARDRIPIMQKTGVLFGNRSELWWDHPVRASFEWKRRVWDIEDKTYARMFTMACDLLGLDEFLDTFSRELSLGQRMRANLGLMLLHDPSLILLDEPTLGLDVLAKRRIIDCLKRMNREEGKTLLVTSHDIDDLTEMAQRIMLLSKGKLAFDGKYDALTLLTGDKRLLCFTAREPEPDLHGAVMISREGDRHCYEYDAGSVSIAALLRSLAEIPGVRDVETGRAPIESVIAELYRGWTED